MIFGNPTDSSFARKELTWANRVAKVMIEDHLNSPLARCESAVVTKNKQQVNDLTMKRFPELDTTSVRLKKHCLKFSKNPSWDRFCHCRHLRSGRQSLRAMGPGNRQPTIINLLNLQFRHGSLSFVRNVRG
jgi:hypothetical protein